MNSIAALVKVFAPTQQLSKIQDEERILFPSDALPKLQNVLSCNLPVLVEIPYLLVAPDSTGGQSKKMH